MEGRDAERSLERGELKASGIGRSIFSRRFERSKISKSGDDTDSTTCSAKIGDPGVESRA